MKKVAQKLVTVLLSERETSNVRHCVYPCHLSTGQNSQMHSLPNNWIHTVEQLHPDSKDKDPVVGADRPLPVSALQTHPRQVLCRPHGPRHGRRAGRPDFVL